MMPRHVGIVENGLNLTQAVEQAVRKIGRDKFTKEDILLELKKTRKQPMNVDSIGATLSQMYLRGEITRVAKGTYIKDLRPIKTERARSYGFVPPEKPQQEALDLKLSEVVRQAEDKPAYRVVTIKLLVPYTATVEYNSESNRIVITPPVSKVWGKKIVDRLARLGVDYNEVKSYEVVG